jgi:hypothetical protein
MSMGTVSWHHWCKHSNATLSNVASCTVAMSCCAFLGVFDCLHYLLRRCSLCDCKALTALAIETNLVIFKHGLPICCNSYRHRM